MCDHVHGDERDITLDLLRDTIGRADPNINTWLLGKITQDRAIEKMRNLIANYPDVGPRLASQRTGSFFLLTGTTKRELKADRSLMETAQLAESEVADLARRTHPTRPSGDRRNA